MNRLISAVRGYGILLYDSVGNRMSASAGGAATAYDYTAKSNQLSAVTAGGVKQAIGYDKAGTVTSLVRFDERGWETGPRPASPRAPILDSTVCPVGSTERLRRLADDKIVRPTGNRSLSNRYQVH